jgi:hypothetical protein
MYPLGQWIYSLSCLFWTPMTLRHQFALNQRQRASCLLGTFKEQSNAVFDCGFFFSYKSSPGPNRHASVEKPAPAPAPNFKKFRRRSRLRLQQVGTCWRDFHVFWKDYQLRILPKVSAPCGSGSVTPDMPSSVSNLSNVRGVFWNRNGEAFRRQCQSRVKHLTLGSSVFPNRLTKCTPRYEHDSPLWMVYGFCAKKLVKGASHLPIVNIQYSHNSAL